MEKLRNSREEEAALLYPKSDSFASPLNGEEAALLHPQRISFSSPPKGESIVESLRSSLSKKDVTLDEEGTSREGLIGSEIVDYGRLRPQAMRPGERTVSTSLRLRRQGFTLPKSGSVDFAVKSIRRGSDEWNGLLRPFVSDLAFRSLEFRRSQSEVSFRSYTCQAAVLFVDLSDYSKITAALAYRGAHALSSIVNEYLSRLLAIVNQHGGDVVKFAGDAVLVVWEGEEKDLEMNVLTAAKCVMEMQEKAGCHVIEGTSLCFRIHCGLCFGRLESEIFAAPNHVNMQHLYHSVGGESMVEISELVAIAKSGETCISDRCLAYLGDHGSYKKVDGISTCRLLTKLHLDKSQIEAIDMNIEQTLSDRLYRRSRRIEEEFIHPSVIRLLGHGGLSPTQIAQMRNLCVLFIAMTSNGSSVNWLMEVQSILDTNRCPSTYLQHVARCDTMSLF
jgi:class 3 adenylate cyclase